VTRVVSFLNQKGGVGKSTLTVNLAAVKADAYSTIEEDFDSPVAAISIDPQGSALWWADGMKDTLPFMIAQTNAADDEQINMIKNLPGIEHVFIDTPGWIGSGEGHGNEVGAVAQRAVIKASDLVVIPMLCEALSFEPTARTVELVQSLGKKFVVVINRWDARDGRTDLDETRKFLSKQGWPTAKTTVRQYKIHTRAAADGQVVTQYNQGRVGVEARQDFYRLSMELDARMEAGAR
jgi:chromosome partitioning protein